MSLVVPRSLARSEECLARARRVIPGASQTLSKGPDQFIAGVYPFALARGRGCRVWDVDGNEYIDYPMGLGPVILGHAYPPVVDAVARQLADGTAFTLPHPLEAEVAEMIVECVPSAEMVRFAKNGSDVTAAAVRLARAVTGREHVAQCGYHGWHDWTIAATSRRLGVPAALTDLVHPFAYNDIEALERIFAAYPGAVAAVILEHGGEDPCGGFLDRVRELADREGAVLIFDEIVTGFRYSLGGAQERYGVRPDLTCLGKALANGLPLAALAGRRDLMRACEAIFFSGTFAGEAASLAAARATLDELRKQDVVGHLWRLGAAWKQGMNDLARSAEVEVECTGHPPRTGLRFGASSEAEAAARRALFLQAMVERGVLFGGPIFMTFSHTEADIARTLEAAGESLAVLARAVAEGRVRRELRGPVPRPIFGLGERTGRAAGSLRATAVPVGGGNGAAAGSPGTRAGAGSVSAVPGAPGRTVAVVGCGSIGLRHLSNLRALGVGRLLVCEPDPARRAAAAAAAGGAPAYPDVPSLLAGERPDAAFICTPTSFHLAAAVPFAERGIHLFVEKPLSDTLVGVEPFLSLAAARGARVMMGMCYRFHPGLAAVKGLLVEGAIGRLYAAQMWSGHYLPDWRPQQDYRRLYSAQRALGGGVILDSIHSVDTMRWLLGEPVRVACYAARLGPLEIDTEDLAAAIYVLEGGAVVELHVDYLQRLKQSRVVLVGSEGTIEWDWTLGGVRLLRPGSERDIAVASSVNDMYLAEARHFLECMENGGRPSPDGAEGRRTLAWALAARRAAELGRFVGWEESGS